MLERLTTSARRIVERAVLEVVAGGGGRLGAEHLFVALLGEPEGLAVEVLTELGAPPDRLLAELDRRRHRYLDGLGEEDAEALATIGIDLEEVLRRMDRPVEPQRLPGRPRFTREAKKVLELSVREAAAMRTRSIGSEHLLLALARGDHPLIRDVLAAMDISLAALRAGVADAVRKAG